MHELSIMSSILDIVIEHANKNDAKKINSINLSIGMLSDVLPEWAQNYFEFVSKDTIAEKAVLNIKRIPVKIRCRECGSETEFKDREWSFTCPSCTSAAIELVSGRELSIESIEID